MLGLSILPAAYGQVALPAEIQRSLQQAGIPLDHAAAYVHRIGAAQPAFTWNAQKPMNPASVMKLVTTLAGLELLGSQFSWKTGVHMVGRLDDGVLDGDLVLKGGGDPRLTIEHFTALIGELRKRGLRVIRGDLILDRSYFESAPTDPAEFDQEPLRPYNVGPYAVLANFKAVKFQFVPDAIRKIVTVEPEPKLAQLDLQHSIRLAPGRCADWRTGIKTDVSGTASTARVSFSGTMPAACGEQWMYLSVLSHPEFVFGMFKQLWEEQGGSILGRWREATAPAGTTALLTHTSPPLTDVVRDINKFSNNVMARQLFLTLSAEMLQLPGRADRSTRAVQSWLTAKKLSLPDLVLENGSGLSRIERISARGIVEVLLHAQRGPAAQVFLESLPVVAVDGTMHARMRREEVAGRAFIKTGGLAGVATIAGYVQARDGGLYGVAFFVNHPNAMRTYAAQDAFLRWVYDSAGAPPSTAPRPK